MRGVNVPALSKILGHAKVSMTENDAHSRLTTSTWRSPEPSAS